MRDRERALRGVPLPERRSDRWLLAAGAGALLAVIPMLWIWLLYGSSLGQGAIYAGGIGLSLIALGIGMGMIRILDGAK